MWRHHLCSFVPIFGSCFADDSTNVQPHSDANCSPSSNDTCLWLHNKNLKHKNAKHAHKNIEDIKKTTRHVKKLTHKIKEKTEQKTHQKTNVKTEVLADEDALSLIAKDPANDIVVLGIVGAAGLVPAMAAAKSGKRLLVANKEILVMAGGLFMSEVKAYLSLQSASGIAIEYSALLSSVGYSTHVIL